MNYINKRVLNKIMRNFVFYRYGICVKEKGREFKYLIE